MTVFLSLPRYALTLIDTVKVGANSAVCLTEGSKDPSDFIFRFEASDSGKPETSKSTKAKPPKPAPSEPRVPKTNGVVVGSKVLRGKTRQQFLDPDASKTVSAKIAEHQKELHLQRQEEGIARYADEDGGTGEDRGKSWKRFTAYKGEAGLPRETESLRVCSALSLVDWSGLCFLMTESCSDDRYTLIGGIRASSYP